MVRILYFLISATDNYGKDDLLVKARDLASFQKPCDRDYRSVRNWIGKYAPLVSKEQAFIKHKEDVLTLHVGREWCEFDVLVEWLLLKADCKFVRVSHNSQTCRQYLLID